MTESKKLDLSKVFRPHLDQPFDERAVIKERLMEQKLIRMKNQSARFLLDKRYTLKLDELV
jgi:hypothetical protein